MAHEDLSSNLVHEAPMGSLHNQQNELVIHDNHVYDRLRDDIMESPMQGNMELSDGNSDGHDAKCDADIARSLDELVIKFAGLADSSMVQSNDDEEGAIQEDFVPFQRVPHDCPPSTSLHVLNLPPELDLDAVSNLFLDYIDLFKKVFSFETNKLHVICNTIGIAKLSQEKLDGLALKNREIQVVFSPKIDLARTSLGIKLAAPPPLPPKIKSTYTLGKIKSDTNYMLGPGTLSLYNSGILPPPSFTYPASLVGIPPPPPCILPSHPLYKNKSRHFDTKRSLMSLLNNPLYSSWNEGQSILERHEEFSNLHNKFGFVQRYLLIENLSISVTIPNLESWIKNSCGHPCPQVHLFDIFDLGSGRLLDLNASLENLPETFLLHMAFGTRKQALDAHRSLVESNPELPISYTAPLLPTNTLWIGNLGDLLKIAFDVSQVKELLGSFGVITNFKCLIESNCVFVSYQDVSSAIKARNQLLAAPLVHESSQTNTALNVDFSSPFTNLIAKQRSSGLDSDCNGDNIEQRLISILKATPEGEKLLEEFLSDSSKYLNINEALNAFQNNKYEDESNSKYDGRFGRDRLERVRNRGFSERGHVPRVDRFGRTIRERADSRRSPPRKRVLSSDNELENLKKLKPPIPSNPLKPSIVCQLLKRGKEICKVSAVFISGESSIEIPRMLDVNQRAHPERLSALLDKSPKISIWQLGADTRQDSIQYDKLCDYLITKNRVALLQYENLQVYIVPPYDRFIEILKVPDANFMYCYLIPNPNS